MGTRATSPSHCQTRDSQSWVGSCARRTALFTTIDHLFDKGFISFEEEGNLIVSPVADRPSLLKMGIGPEGQRIFLECHRENVLRMSRGRE